ncbi:MAG: hypothetical protein CXX69_04215 [Candidatus Thalassarchaeum betae]|uniref:Heme-copper oxidase subunit III family profile domain-containing protein n=1 Tax=Candidatus Thalassarchaeum betae TaxID=2599289 RepID=A0A2V3HRI6_9ARCH|nr:MAG: hypothetical protein CXX69_04215 [Candidatus Thalassoarchaea betae]PXF26405.1 MAG: hypothetical protein CXX70_03520 [Euryarchaeota archaeon]HIC50435.1 heme-copper oxidase subunit III [Candidatus Poseidoniales archaeon]HIM13145.1 heme-copper oxidase subunit III [Candidatus Poseidoniales archaeon]HIM92392.1 heme-copper oxidase subunit III [Candidatus Poseidoniales archaeon]
MSDDYYGHDEDHPSPWGPHDWDHGAPHNSWFPVIMAIGIGIFLLMFARVFSFGEYDFSYLPMVFVGLAVVAAAMIVWWRQDMSFDGTYEPRSSGAPFKSIQIRKVGTWVFLMSEMMIFTALFSTYMRYRFGIPRCDTVFESGDWVEGTAVTCFEPASHLIASSWWHIAPGATNTFALIISSFTIVQALRWAHKPEGSVDEEVRRKRIYRYLGATWCLAALFLTLKIIEWFIGFHVPEIGFLGLQEHEIPSLYSEGYLINNDHYQHHDYIDETGAHMMANIRVSATMFYVTTGTHGFHVLGGLIGLTYLTYKAWTGAYTPQSAVSIEYFGLYWHFVDLIWVLVFPFFYLY